MAPPGSMPSLRWAARCCRAARRRAWPSPGTHRAPARNATMRANSRCWAPISRASPRWTWRSPCFGIARNRCKPCASRVATGPHCAGCSKAWPTMARPISRCWAPLMAPTKCCCSRTAFPTTGKARCRAPPCRPMPLVLRSRRTLPFYVRWRSAPGGAWSMLWRNRQRRPRVSSRMRRRAPGLKASRASWMCCSPRRLPTRGG